MKRKRSSTHYRNVKRRRAWKHETAAIRIQYAWRKRYRTCCLQRTWIPLTDRIRISGHTFSVRALRTYIRRTGDDRHPITRQVYAKETLTELRIARFQLRRFRRKFLLRIEERDSLSRIVMDEFNETLESRTFNFAALIIFVKSYVGLLNDQEECIQAHLTSLLNEMHMCAKNEGTPTARLIYRMTRCIMVH